MRVFKFALILAAIGSSLSGMVYAQIEMARKGMFTAEDAYSQMGGMPFRLASLDSSSPRTVAQLNKAD